jgi:hypothetical protein
MCVISSRWFVRSGQPTCTCRDLMAARAHQHPGLLPEPRVVADLERVDLPRLEVVIGRRKADRCCGKRAASDASAASKPRRNTYGGSNSRPRTSSKSSTGTNSRSSRMPSAVKIRALGSSGAPKPAVWSSLWGCQLLRVEWPTKQAGMDRSWRRQTDGSRRRKPATSAGMCTTSAGPNTGTVMPARRRVSVTTTPLSTSRGGRNPPPPSAQLGPPSSVEPTVRPGLAGLVAVKRGREPATQPGNNPQTGCESRDH